MVFGTRARGYSQESVDGKFAYLVWPGFAGCGAVRLLREPHDRGQTCETELNDAAAVAAVRCRLFVRY